MWRLDGTHVHDLGGGRRASDPRTTAAEEAAAAEIVRILSGQAPDPDEPCIEPRGTRSPASGSREAIP